jgi:hypothetical protein
MANRQQFSVHSPFSKSCKSVNNIGTTRLLFRKVSTFSGFRLIRHVTVTPDIATTLHADEVGLPMYKVSEGIRSTHGQDGAIVLDIRQGQMFNLNFVGSRILELLETGATESAIVDEISQKFGVSRDVAESDVREFIGSLKQHNLLEDPATNGHH